MTQLNELKIHRWLQNVLLGSAAMSDETIERVAGDISAALSKQFKESRKGQRFRWRMSNVGRPYCQMWYDKNHPNAAKPHNTTFLLNMIVGDIVEAIFKGIMTEAGVKYEDSKQVTAKFGDQQIDGTNDLTIDNKVWDVKTASAWSYNNKFSSAADLAQADTFGYVAQLCGYAEAEDIEPGGWIVINKNNMEFKFVSYDLDNKKEVVQEIADKTAELERNEFRRCYEPIAETFYKKPTGNMMLSTTCGFCAYREDCWDGKVSEEPSRVSKAANKPMVVYLDDYVHRQSV